MNSPHQALIVARMAPESAPDIAELFAASDGGELPHLVGVTRRSLFQFGDVYMHLIESDRPPGPAIAQVTEHPAFKDISDRLTAFVSPYDPQTWRSPKDAMARQFYRWERDSTA
ncbi:MULTISPECIES: TcmI family type II polyketide cyclase [Streptomyces]|uniref:TcmI family type II polyketide cyclase n=1 Tax=Streptomyces achmelvichensis TaxID=3134111 RepID=A0ACC6Q3H8_9ACTN|nr:MULTISPECIES: TcmI family type II polyketide cyclase [unclassified Streptomyces]WNO71633.1 TcmI family type II polyketide cyclase [Streptomyces sp. AM8-1-1]WST40824.1 TcmI family type II polyketide cyclase [Streptomyces sp. NBC_01167]